MFLSPNRSFTKAASCIEFVNIYVCCFLCLKLLLFFPFVIIFYLEMKDWFFFWYYSDSGECFDFHLFKWQKRKIQLCFLKSLLMEMWQDCWNLRYVIIELTFSKNIYFILHICSVKLVSAALLWCGSQDGWKLPRTLHR